MNDALPPRRSVSHRPTRRRGGIYVALLGCATAVAVIGFSAIALVRIDRRATAGLNDMGYARAAALSAVDLGVLLVKSDPDWRTARANGAWLSNRALGDATFSLLLTDDDGDLADDPRDAVTLRGIGDRGAARYQLQLRLTPDRPALAALQTALHAGGDVTVNTGKTVSASGGPLSLNGALNNNGTITGNVEAVSVSRAGTIVGVLSTPVAAKDLPFSDVFDSYVARATTISPPGGTIHHVVLSPGSNPWGATNADGLYYINAVGADVTISNARIDGTLLVRTNGNKLIVNGTVCMTNHRSDYPVLIVDGDARLGCTTDAAGLSESTQGTNFNPAGSPYQGATDNDTTDTYPGEIQGLVHVRGTLLLEQTATVRGGVICESTVDCNGSNTLVLDPTLYSNPPDGYRGVGQMLVVPGSWQRVVDP